jgi:hypothetical protein
VPAAQTKTGTPRTWKRKWWRYPFLDPGLQLRLALIPAIVCLVNAAFFTVLLGYYSRASFLRMARWLPEYVSPEDLAHVQFELWPRTLMVVVGFETLAIFAFALFFSHRIAGPAYAIKLRLHDLAHGKIPALMGLRRGSFLGPLVSTFNEAIRRLRERHDKTKNEIETVLHDLDVGKTEQAAKRLSALINYLDRRSEN